MKDIRKVLLIVNMHKRDVGNVVTSIESYFHENNIETFFYGLNGKSIPPEINGFDLAFSLGGDGTVLFSARLLAPFGIPILPVNLGDFGFIAEVARDEWKVAFEKYWGGLLGVGEHLMLDISVIRGGKRIAEFTGLNDSVVCSSGISKIVRLHLSLADTELGEYRADGIIVSTPTGSTAYSAAAGGPILDPEMEAMIINPICPFTLSNRPIVVPGEEKVYIEIKSLQRTDVILTIDGQSTIPLLPKDCIQVKRAEKKACIIRSDKRNFYEVLRSKLHWSGGPDA